MVKFGLLVFNYSALQIRPNGPTNSFLCSKKCWFQPGNDSGCTAVVALIRGKKLYVANAGDSRCIVCREGKAIEMSAGMLWRFIRLKCQQLRCYVLFGWNVSRYVVTFYSVEMSLGMLLHFIRLKCHQVRWNVICQLSLFINAIVPLLTSPNTNTGCFQMPDAAASKYTARCANTVPKLRTLHPNTGMHLDSRVSMH